MDDITPSRASRTDVQAAWLLLDKMGLTLADLQAAAPAAGTPSFRAYIPQVAAAVSPGTRRVYGSYWAKVADAWGDRPISEPTALEVGQLAEQVRAGAVQRANGRGGRGAAEHLIAALRCLYRYAVAEHIIAAADNPAAQVAKPRRLRSTRMALTGSRLTELYEVAGSTGDDPALDTLLLRLHTETACRPGGALSLRPGSLDRDLCLVRLCEKGETMRWQPISPTLMTHLLAHGEHRGGLSTDTGLLRYADGRPITKRRYNYLWERLGQHLPWVAQLNVSTGWIRHTTLTWVERRWGFAVAEAYAGHEDNGKGARSMAAMGTYIRADLPEVATALAALTGEPHPLATQTQAPGCHEAADDARSGR